MSEWILEYDGFDPEQERLREALCTLGNGYFATRGAAAEATASTVHYPATYLAGGFNRLITDIAGRPIVNEDLVNFPNWLHLTFKPEGGEWFNLLAVEILSYRQELHLKNGLLNRDIRFRDKQGNIFTLSTRRLVHMADPHLAAMETAISSENWSGKMRIKSELDGSVINAGVDRYKQLNSKHLETLNLGKAGDDSVYLVVRTVQSRIEMAQAARTRMFLNGKRMTPEIHSYEEKEVVGQELEFDLAKGKTFKVEKIVSLYTCRDAAISECSLAAQEAVSRAGRFTELLDSHTRAWHSLWRRYDVEVRAKDQAQLVLRLHIFHLLQTISPHTIGLDVGVPARGLHGEAYRGHIFWDEMFMFFFYSLRIPEVTRSLLLYRYRRLDAARAGAKEAGYEGAMYPWQSGSDGSEETQKVHLNPISGRWIDDHSRLQRHVNIAIVYNVWQYYQASGDMEFLVYYGAEMMLEIARFWASIATYNKKTKRYEIKGVMGPDEYHEKYPNSEKGGLNNNAYTNVMAVWVLERAIEVLDLLDEERRSELFEELNLKKEEIQRWKDITCKMTVPFHGDGIISQFEGYDQLEEFDWDRYRHKYGDIERLDRILEAENDSANRYKVSKQADVLMLFYLFSAEELGELLVHLGYRFEYDTIPSNVEYYLRRTSHGSSLSRLVNSWVLARSDRPGAWPLFIELLRSDINDIQHGTTPEGIHTGAMAGTVDLIQRCFTGIETRGDVLWLNPRLPKGLNSLTLNIHYREHLLGLHVTRTSARISTEPSTRKSIRIGITGEIHELNAGEVREFQL